MFDPLAARYNINHRQEAPKFGSRISGKVACFKGIQPTYEWSIAIKDTQHDRPILERQSGGSIRSISSRVRAPRRRCSCFRKFSWEVRVASLGICVLQSRQKDASGFPSSDCWVGFSITPAGIVGRLRFHDRLDLLRWAAIPLAWIFPFPLLFGIGRDVCDGPPSSTRGLEAGEQQNQGLVDEPLFHICIPSLSCH